MSIAVELEELLVYSDHERSKWRRWMAADPSRMEVPVQQGGRFPTADRLLQHIVLTERRHLARLEGGTPPEETGVAPGDWEALFDYAEFVRADFRRYVADLDEATGAETLTFTVSTGPVTTTRRKLALHIVLHETRHMAQLALAARLAGHEPPGAHDYFYCPGAPGA